MGKQRCGFVENFKAYPEINDTVENKVLKKKKCGKLRGKRGRLWRVFSTWGKTWRSAM